MRAERGAEEGGIEPHVAASRRGGCVRQAECALAPLLGAVVLRPSSDTMQDPSCGGARVHLRAPSAGRGAHWSSWATHLRRRASAYTHESRRGSRRLCSSGGSRTCATPSSMPSATVATCSTPTRLRPCSMLSAPPPASWSMAASITSTSPMGQHRSAPLLRHSATAAAARVGEAEPTLGRQAGGSCRAAARHGPWACRGPHRDAGRVLCHGFAVRPVRLPSAQLAGAVPKLKGPSST